MCAWKGTEKVGAPTLNQQIPKGGVRLGHAGKCPLFSLRSWTPNLGVKAQPWDQVCISPDTSISSAVLKPLSRSGFLPVFRHPSGPSREQSPNPTPS